VHQGRPALPVMIGSLTDHFPQGRALSGAAFHIRSSNAERFPASRARSSAVLAAYLPSI
jgi:hypothetical protein